MSDEQVTKAQKESVGVEALADWFYENGHEFVVSDEEDVARMLLDRFCIIPRGASNDALAAQSAAPVEKPMRHVSCYSRSNMTHESGPVQSAAPVGEDPFNRKQVEAVCRAVCAVEGVDPDDDVFGDGCDAQWTRYADAVAAALDVKPGERAAVNLHWLVDWVHLYATEGNSWISKISADRLIALASRAPTQEDANLLATTSLTALSLDEVKPDV